MMRKLTLLIAIIAFVAVAMSAQVTENEAAMSQGSNNAFTIDLQGTNKKSIQKSWTKFLKKKYDIKAKRKKKTNELFADNATIKDLSSNTVDIYSSIQQNGSDCKLTVWFDLGGAYLNSQMHGAKVQVAEKMLNDFGLRVSKKMVEENLKKEEKTLKGLKKDQKNLEKRKKDLEKEIADSEERIKKAKAEIEKNLQDQKTKQGEIQKQQNVVNDVKTTLKELK